jgi:hypothetical protein
MRRGAPSHLMRCSDGHYYVVKFQNNPQHRRILVNEMLGTRLASRLGLPAAVRVVQVPEELVRLTAELCIETPRSRIACTPSRYPGDPRRVTLHDFLPDEKLCAVDNLHDFAGMLVFDKWTCNTNGRQTVFFEIKRNAQWLSPGATGTAAAEAAQTTYHTVMIDQGFCFNAGEWNFPDAPLRGLYARNRVYQGVIGMESFAPWLERIEKQITERVLAELGAEIPPAWYDDYDALVRLLEQIYRRKERVPELLLAARRSSRQPFGGWRA